MGLLELQKLKGAVGYTKEEKPKTTQGIRPVSAKKQKQLDEEKAQRDAERNKRTILPTKFQGKED